MDNLEAWEKIEYERAEPNTTSFGEPSFKWQPQEFTHYKYFTGLKHANGFEHV